MSELKLGELLEKYPFVSDFFESTGFCIDSSLSLTFSEFLDNISQEELEDKAIDKKEKTVLTHSSNKCYNSLVIKGKI